MSMLRPSLNQLMAKNESCYSVVVGIAKRAREIADELYDQKKELKEITAGRKMAMYMFASIRMGNIQEKENQLSLNQLKD